MFTLRLLGSVSLEGPGGAVKGRIAARQPLAVLAVLAASGEKGISRDKLIGYFWADRDMASARHRLSNTLYIIRKALGEESVSATGEVLRLDLEAIWSDLGAFERAAEEADLETVAELYLGPFLDGFYVDGEGAGEFEHWIEPVRQRLARTYTTAVEKLATRAEKAGDHLGALGWWERLAASDPYNSRYAVRLVQALTAARDPANALQFASNFERRLREDLQMEPDPELRELAEQLRREPMPAGVKAARVVMQSEETGFKRRDAGELDRSDRTTSTARLRASRSTVYAAGIVLVLAATWLAVRAQQMFLPPGALQPEPQDALALRVVSSEPRERIVLADFADEAPASNLGLLVTEALRIDLAQSREFALLGGERLQLALVRMRADRDSGLDLAVARELARREGVLALISGAIHEADEGFTISARVVSVTTGDVIFDAKEVAADSGEIITAVGRLSRALREGIGEPLHEIEESALLPQVTTSSLEALRLYAEAVRARWAGHPTRAMRFLDEAIAIDSAFAMAYSKLALFSVDIGRSERLGRLGRIEAHTRAFELSEGLPPRERHSIALLYHYVVRGDVDEAIRSARALVNDYPDDYSGVIWLANLYSLMGNYAPSEFYYRQAIALDSSNARGYHAAFALLVHLGKLDDAKRTHERMAARFPDHPWTWYLSSALARLSGDYGTARGYLEGALRLPDIDLWERLNALRQLGAVARTRGQLSAGEQYLLDAVDATIERQRPAGCLEHIVPIALADVSLRDDREKARLRIDRALEQCPLSEIEPSLRPYSPLAQVYAAAAHADEARALLVDYDAAFPLESRNHLQHLAYRMALAELALAEGRPSDAIREARLIEQQKLCWFNLCDVSAFVLLGRAFDLAGQPDSALVYYERYAQAPGYIRMWPDSYWLGPAYERLASLHGERAQQEDEAQYLRLLIGLWEDADPELRPRVQEAQARLEEILRERG